MKVDWLATGASLLLFAAILLVVYCGTTEGTAQLVAAFAGGCCGTLAIHLTIAAAAAKTRERADR